MNLSWPGLHLGNTSGDFFSHGPLIFFALGVARAEIGVNRVDTLRMKFALGMDCRADLCAG
jgi:hypothetical protein